jgi:hypothetical protein
MSESIDDPVHIGTAASAGRRVIAALIAVRDADKKQDRF